MARAWINNCEVTLNDGILRCADADVLALVEMFAVEYDSEYRGCSSDPEQRKLDWIADKLKGSVCYIEEPEEFIFGQELILSARY